MIKKFATKSGLLVLRKMSTTRKEPSLDTKNSGRKMRAISEASISDSKKATTIMPTKKEGGTLQNRGQPM